MPSIRRVASRRRVQASAAPPRGAGARRRGCGWAGRPRGHGRRGSTKSGPALNGAATTPRRHSAEQAQHDARLADAGVGAGHHQSWQCQPCRRGHGSGGSPHVGASTPPRTSRTQRPAWQPLAGTGCRSGAGRREASRPRGSRRTSRTARPASLRSRRRRETPGGRPRAPRSRPRRDPATPLPPGALVPEAEHFRVKQLGKEFKRLNQARTGPVEVLVAVGQVNASGLDGSQGGAIRIAQSRPAVPAATARCRSRTGG